MRQEPEVHSKVIDSVSRPRELWAGIGEIARQNRNAHARTDRRKHAEHTVHATNTGVVITRALHPSVELAVHQG